MSLTFDEYQKKAWTTAKYRNKGNNIYYPTMGLGSEAGEVLGKVKRMMRDQDTDSISLNLRDKIIDELGDVLWYIAAIATELNTSLNTIAYLNIDKLFDRKERNVISGEGDER